MTELRVGERTRQAILDEALKAFCANGFERAALRELADQLGITTAALYYYFDSKADILASLVEPLLDDLDEVVHGPLTESSEVLGAAFDVLLKHRTVVMLVVRDRAVALQPGIGDRLEKQRTQLLDRLTATAGDEAAAVLATAALGALLRPLVDLADVDLQPHRDLLVTASTALLSHAHPRT
ncbi:MAG TPA: helix-turn-helix domain-containing protein [Aquihabitans sp.]|jgi:AcrR family transcriptional regulator|nr:helix-turn-helix domain-containing protein [Aquihabitans sp.]